MKVKTQVPCERCQVVSNEKELALNQATFFALAGLVDRQKERIERLEKIVLSMTDTNSLLTTWPDAGEIHTHQIYLAGRVQERILRCQHQSKSKSISA